MYLLLSGEGSSDIGRCELGLEQCEADYFQPGPMSWFIDQLVEDYQNYEFSHLENNCVSFIPEKTLAANKPEPSKKAIELRGKKKPVETQYYYKNARTLAIAAKRKSEQINDVVIAVLFHDSDGTASAGRGNWQNKRNAMLAGFAKEDYAYGVAMMPKPKSEAWLLCAVKNNPYQHCQKLEDESGNDTSQRPLKDQLSDVLQGNNSAEQLNDMIRGHEIDVHQIDMPSFNVFKDNLKQVVKSALGLPLGD